MPVYIPVNRVNGAINGGWEDNRDGLSNTLMAGETQRSPLEGQECLVFFLGGFPGLSLGGADQLINGYIVSHPKDRRILGDAMLKELGFGALVGETSIGMLLPAVQPARQAAGSNQGWGTWEINPSSHLSVAGALQFLSGSPVSNPQDRAILAGHKFLIERHFDYRNRFSCLPSS
ncbi:MAG: hypothetical protein WBD22_11780 [Pyrinomonadaceae bacterium]